MWKVKKTKLFLSGTKLEAYMISSLFSSAGNFEIYSGMLKPVGGINVCLQQIGFFSSKFCKIVLVFFLATTFKGVCSTFHRQKKIFF